MLGHSWIYHGWSMNTSWSWISLKLTARPWKWGTLGKGDSLWKPPFLGAILVLGSVIEGADSSTKPHLESDGEEPRSRLQDQSILCSWKCPVLPCYPIGDIWKLIMCKSCIFNIYIYIYNKIGETLATTACSLWTKIDEFHLPKQLPVWSYMYLPLRWNLSNIFIFIPTKRGCLCVVPSDDLWKQVIHFRVEAQKKKPSSVMPWEGWKKMFILEVCGTDLFVQEHVSFAATFFIWHVFLKLKNWKWKINMFVHPGRN